MAIRLKTRWHETARTGYKGRRLRARPKTLDDLAGVLGFNIWKIAHAAYKNMETNGYRFASDRQVMALVIEFVAFLIQLADRMAYGRLTEEERSAFINALAQHLALTVANNQLDLLGPGEYAAAFIATLNARLAGYAECGYGATGPGYDFLRTLGDNVAHVMGASDDKWVLEQVIEIEGPNAVDALKKAAERALDSYRSAPAP